LRPEKGTPHTDPECTILEACRVQPEAVAWGPHEAKGLYKVTGSVTVPPGTSKGWAQGWAGIEAPERKDTYTGSYYLRNVTLKRDTPAAAALPAPGRAELVRHTVPAPPALATEAQIQPDRPTLRANETMVLKVRAATDVPRAWVWAASAGSIVASPGQQARFTPPPDAAPGSVFRITAEAASSPATSLPLRAWIDIVTS
jgi:hypothetical protein